MKLQKENHESLVIAVFATIFVLFLITQMAPQTGKLSILKPAGTSVFALTTAIFVAYEAMLHIEPRWMKIAVMICALLAALWGAAQATTVAKDLITGPQTIMLTDCELHPKPNTDIIVSPSVYTIAGYDETGKYYEFPIAIKEYRSLACRTISAEGSWRTKVNGYLNSERLITFTAEISQKEAQDAQ